MSARNPVVHSVAIYNGRHHLGDIAEFANDQFEALDPDGKRLGLFGDRREAARAILEAAQEAQGG